MTHPTEDRNQDRATSIEDGSSSISVYSQLVDELDQLRTAMAIPFEVDANSLSVNTNHPSDLIPGAKNQLSVLEERYNYLLDQITSLSPGSLSDPLDALPLEVWERIILETGYVDYYMPDHPILVPDGILPLTLVSTRWRGAIVDNPRFWATLLLRPGVEDLEAKLASSISLSKDFPLTVLVDEINGNTLWETFGYYIVSQRSRIRCLILDYYSQPDMVDIVFSSIGEAPLLQILQVIREGEPSAISLNFIKSAKYIRSITGNMSLSINNLRCLSLDRIRTMNVVEANEETLAHLATFSTLENVDFTNGSERRPHAGGTGLLPWKIFHFRGCIDGIIEHILQKVTPSLIELKTFIQWQDVPKLLILCNNMPQLQSLSIMIITKSLPPQAEKIQFHPLDLIPSDIRHLDLRYDDLRNFTLEEANLATLFSNLQLLAPNVQFLMCLFPTHGAFLNYVCSLQCLKNVVMGFPRQTSACLNGLAEIGVLKTERLCIYDPAPSKLMKTSGIMNLDTGDRHFTRQLMSSEWKDLIKLTLPFDAVDWEGVSLPHLTELLFTHYSSFASLASGLNSLCQEIATRPHSFPSLEKLAAYDIPEWDVLFIMLERRNISIPQNSRSKISRIRSLEVLSRPSMSILKPLTKLLGGRFTPRPTYRWLSLIGAAKTLFNPEFPGCVRCHHFRRHCTASKKWKSAIDLSSYRDFFEYPASPEDILTTRARRLKEWELMLGQLDVIDEMVDQSPLHSDKHRITGCCEEMSEMEITESTLDGEQDVKSSHSPSYPLLHYKRYTDASLGVSFDEINMELV